MTIRQGMALAAFTFVSFAFARNVCPPGQPYCFFNGMQLYTQDLPQEGYPNGGLCAPTSAAMALSGAISEDYFGNYYRNYFTNLMGPAWGAYYGRYYSARFIPSQTFTHFLFNNIPDDYYYPRITWLARYMGTSYAGKGTPYANMPIGVGQRGADFWGYGGGYSTGVTFPIMPNSTLAEYTKVKIANTIGATWSYLQVTRRYNKFYISYVPFTGHEIAVNGFSYGGIPEGGIGPVSYIFNPWGIREWYYTKVLDSAEHIFPTWGLPFTYQDFLPAYYVTLITTPEHWWTSFIPEWRASNDNAHPYFVKIMTQVDGVYSD